VLGLSVDPATGGGIAALAIAASAIIAGAVATADYHAVQLPTPADRFPDLPTPKAEIRPSTESPPASTPAAAPEQVAAGSPPREASSP
jgi:hypothetical protein